MTELRKFEIEEILIKDTPLASLVEIHNGFIHYRATIKVKFLVYLDIDFKIPINELPSDMRLTDHVYTTEIIKWLVYNK